MIFRHTLSSNSSSNGVLLGLQPAPAWVAILGLIFFSALCILVGAGRILNLAFPAGAFAVGVLLYFRYPILYSGFTWWMWFLTPFVRRLADYRGGGFTDPSPILLAPYLVTLVTLVTLWQNLPKLYRQGSLSFVLPISSLFYGFLIGLIQQSPATVGIIFLKMLSPALFGLHLFVNWQRYTGYRKNIQRCFLWGVLVTGVYGIVQYLVLPEWDRFWMINVRMGSVGTPQPHSFSVFSTLNSRGPCAVTLMAGLLLQLSSKSPLRFYFSGAGYLALLLTTVRTCWGGLLLGFLIHANSLNLKAQLRLIITVIVICILVVPLTTLEPFSTTISSRFETFSNLEDDASYQARHSAYEYYLLQAMTSIVGSGIGGPSFDSGIITILMQLGWVGSIFYWGGMIQMIVALFQGAQCSYDPFASTARALVVVVFTSLIMGSSVLEISGMFFWGFLGIGLAAQKYYQYQNAIENSKV